MAGDWIKVEKETARKPEVLRVADILGIHPDHAFGLCVRFWFWCDDQLVDGHAPRVTNSTLNAIVGHAGFAEAMAEVGWLNGKELTLVVPNFDRHLSQSAKKRALTTERKRTQRAVDVTPQSRSERDESVTRARGESEREIRTLKGDRKAIGKALRKGESDAEPIDLSPLKDSGSEQEPFDLSEVDWGRVTEWAERLGRKVPAQSVEDRRMWLKFAVLADMSFGEGWLVDGSEAVVRAKETRTTKQRHLVAVLKSKAEDQGVSNENFLAMLSRIDIPKAIWKSGVLGGPK